LGCKLDRIQLKRAIEIVETLLKPELKSNNNSDGPAGARMVKL
jgi:hypothetical protein